MYSNVTQDFIDKLASPSRHFSARFSYNGVPVDLEIKSIKLSSGSCGSGSISVGCAFASYIEVTANYTDELLEGKELFLELGLLLSSGNYEYIPFGYWTVQKPDVQKDVIVFQAFDRIASKLSNEYETELTYPATIAAVISELATKTGVSITCNLQTTEELQAPIDGVTNRGALATIAATLLGNAWCDRTGGIQITAFNAYTSVQVDYDMVKTQPVMDEQTTVIGGVKVYTVRGTTDTWISVGSGHMLEVSDIYLTNDLLTAVSANVVNLAYNGGSVSFMGNPLIDPSDRITFEDSAGVTYSVPCMGIEHSFDGGLLTTVSAPGSFEETEKSYASGPITAAMEQQSKDIATAVAAAESAGETAENAESVANRAITAANGKSKIFYQDSEPQTGMSAGDMWFDTDGGNAVYEYTSSGWVLRQFGQGSIAAGSITAREINVDSLSAISANIGTVTAGILKSSDYSYTSGNTYTTKGMIIDLNNKIIRTPKTAILSDGSIYAKNGVFSGSITVGGADNEDGTITVRNSAGDTIGSWSNTGIIAQAGKIANWTIETNAITNSYTSGSTTYKLFLRGYYDGAPIGNGSIFLSVTSGGTTTYPFSLSYGGTLKATNAIITGQITATSGSIGNFTITSSSNTGTSANGGHVYVNSLYKHTSDSEYEYEVGMTGGGTPGSAAFYVRRIALGSTWATSDIMFMVTSGGSATVRGSVTATSGEIGGFTIDSNSIHTKNVAITSNATNSVGLSSSTFKRTIGGTERTNLKFAIGSGFGVNNTGVLYASGAVISGDITATSIIVTDTLEFTSTDSSLTTNAMFKYEYSAPTFYTLGTGYNDWDAADNALEIAVPPSIGYAATFTLTSRLAINGNLGVNGSFASKTIRTNTLSASSATIGTISANVLRAHSILQVANSYHNGSLYISSTGNFGIYSTTLSKFVLYIPTGQSYLRINMPVTMADTVTCNSTITSAGSITVTGGTEIRIKRSAAVQVDIRANNSAGDVSLRANSDGSNVGLYSYTKSGWIIRMASGGTVTVATTVSDIREKDVIGNLSDAETEIILRSMDIIDYTYKRDKDKLIYNGISAQQLRDTLVSHGIGYRPYLCIESADESGISYHDLMMPEENVRYEIDYVKFTPLLWKGWQLHDGKIMNHEDRIRALERENNRLKNEIEILKGVA